MAHGSSAHSIDSGTDARREVPEAFFKPDHPRAIDRHIDYFGGGDTADDDEDAACGAAALERPA